jgi:hypothetical protein
MPIRLNAEQRRNIYTMRKEGYSVDFIAQRLTLSSSTVSKYVNSIPSEILPSETEQSFDAAYRAYKQYIGWQKPVAPRKASDAVKNEFKIVAINDTHAPAHDDDAIAHIIKTEAHDADVCLIAGDFFDNFNFSRYDKFKRPWTPVQELQRTQALLNVLSESFPKVLIMRGNHDERFLKYLVRLGVPPDVLEYFELLAPGFTNPLARIARDLENVYVVDTITHGFAEFPHIYQLNDVVFSHAELFSRVPNKSVGNVIQWLKSYAEPMGIVKPFRLVAQAHTHQAGKTYNDYGVWGIEMGCLTMTPDYAGDPKLRGAGRPSVVGYTVIYQRDGITDIARSNFIPLKW